MGVVAGFCGFGGGNFSSSMSNISFFYPKRIQGTSLGLNAGLGNLGVSVLQFLVPVVISFGIFGSVGGGGQELVLANGMEKSVWLQNAAFIWVLPVILSAFAALFFMDNLPTARSSLSAQLVIFKRKHMYITTWLYSMSFGSFIGYSAAFPLLIKTQFPGISPLKYSFLGTMVGALIRPFGGWISDKIKSGALITLIDLFVMIFSVFGVCFLYLLVIKVLLGFL